MKNLNPFALLDSILEDYASPRFRRLVHTLVLVGVSVVAIWMAVEGDWKKFAAALAVAFYGEVNRANTDTDHGMIDGVGYYDAPHPVDSEVSG